MKHFSKLMLTAAAVMVSSAAIANDKNPEEAFKKMDSDSNGAVSKTEFLSHAETKFNKIDSNSDGAITLEEKKAWKEDKHS